MYDKLSYNIKQGMSEENNDTNEKFYVIENISNNVMGLYNFQ